MFYAITSNHAKKNKLRWNPQQSQRFIFTNLSEACCEAKRWKPCCTCWTWPGPAPKIPKPSPGPSLKSSPEPVEPLHQSLPDLLQNLLRNPVEPDLALHQSLPEPFFGNLTRRLHQCTPELFWAEDPISLRCWGKRLGLECAKTRLTCDEQLAVICVVVFIYHLKSSGTNTPCVQPCPTKAFGGKQGSNIIFPRVRVKICLKLGGNYSRPRGYSIPSTSSTSFCILDFVHNLKPLATISTARYQQTLCPAKAFGGKQGSNIIFPKVNAFRILFKVWRQPFSRLGKTPQVGFCSQVNLHFFCMTNKERHSLITTCPLDR